MNSHDKKLPRAGIKRFGHRSHTRWDRMARDFDRKDILNEWAKSYMDKWGIIPKDELSQTKT